MRCGDCGKSFDNRLKTLDIFLYHLWIEHNRTVFSMSEVIEN